MQTWNLILNKYCSCLCCNIQYVCLRRSSGEWFGVLDWDFTREPSQAKDIESERTQSYEYDLHVSLWQESHSHSATKPFSYSKISSLSLSLSLEFMHLNLFYALLKILGPPLYKSSDPAPAVIFLLSPPLCQSSPWLLIFSLFHFHFFTQSVQMHANAFLSLLLLLTYPVLTTSELLSSFYFFSY